MRKQSIEKRSKENDNEKNESLNTTKVSLRPLSSRISTASSKNIAESVQELQNLNQSDFESKPIDKLEKEIAEAIRGVAEANRGVLVSQKLGGYKECTLLITKYNQYLKKQAKSLNESNSALVLTMYKSISEELNKVTKEERHEQLVLESNIISPVMALLHSFASDTETLALNSKDKKGSLMRKNSLKKSMETTGSTITSLRPTSRGKLSSLSKKEKITSKNDIIEAKITSQENETETIIGSDMTALETIIWSTCCTLKNISANKLIRRDLLKEDYLRTINRYLSIWNEKTLSQFGTNVLMQLTAASRYIANEEKSEKLFLKSNCLEAWTKVIEMFPTSNDLVFNMIRILSKLSARQDICEKLNEKKQFLKTLTSFFKLYKGQIHIIIRISYVFANMTSFLADIRTQLYFDFQAWDDIYTCFEFYANSELKGKSEVDKMGVSMAAWDYTAMKKESDIEALMKIIRLIANLFTLPEIGNEIYREHSTHYRSLIKTLKVLLEKKSNLEKHNELIACVLSCLTNTLYYDREMLLSSPEYKIVKKELVDVLVDFVVQIDNEEVCCESLRVVSNLTRMKQFVKPVLDAKLHEAVLILLDSTSKEIVYYCLGVIINLLADEEFKSSMGSILIDSIVEILKECQSDDFDIVSVALKALFGIVDNKTENIEPKQLALVENCLVNLGATCDKTMLNGQNSELQSAQESRNLINALLNSMPEDKFFCPVESIFIAIETVEGNLPMKPNCKIMFPEDIKLLDELIKEYVKYFTVCCKR